MQLRTYRARTVADALAQIKKDLGRDAVILHTRQCKVGGVFGFGAKPIVEITASSGLQIATPPLRRDRSPSPAAAAERIRRAYAVPIPDPASPAPAAPVSASPAPTSVAAPPAPSTTMEEELRAIKGMVARVLSSSSGRAVPAMPDALLTRYLRLVEGEVASHIADEIVAAVRNSLKPKDLEDDQKVHDEVLRQIASYIPVAERGSAADSPPSRSRSGRPYTIALVGPTGVGKTTTLAKLAATYKLRHNRRIGLVTADTYRIAAVDQLRTYANIIGLPLKVASSPADMTAACDSLSDCSIILVDTAGRSPHDDARLGELRAYLEAARPDETHLVLSSAASEQCMLGAAERFGVVKPTHLIFTKLDEAVSFGVLLNVARRVDSRLSFITTGQEVPDKIEAGRADRIARLVLDGRLPA